MTHKYSAGDYLFQFITILAGVLIAMLANGWVERNEDRELVAQARATIQREIADNKVDLEKTVSSFSRDRESLDNAVQFAVDMLGSGKTTITTIGLHYNMADLLDAGWRTAERTGALSHMDYSEVQRYSKLYDFQELFVQNQRDALSLLTQASSLIGPGFDPDKPNRADLERFRERVLSLRATLGIQEDFAKRLIERYDEVLGIVKP